MKFLLQTINGKVTLDLVFQLERAIEYLQWRHIDVQTEYCELEELGRYKDNPIVSELVPVGTVEFVLTFCKLYIHPDAKNIIHPLNVPEELMVYRMDIANLVVPNFGTTIKIDDWLANRGFESERYYVKSNDVIKSDINDVYNLPDLYNLPAGSYQISEYIDDIESEYRVFVYKGQIMGIKHYSGDFTKFPDVSSIKYYVGLLDDLDYLKAYTLDVYISKSTGETYVMEVHEFFSCGLYGFDDLQALPYMFSRQFYEIKCRLLQQYRI